jgi:uncharacterized membrane protein YfcA
MRSESCSFIWHPKVRTWNRRVIATDSRVEDYVGSRWKEARSLHLSGAELAVVLAAVLVGAVIQGSIGFGMNLVAVPAVALVEPAALPATLILVAFPLSVGVFAREHHAVDTSGVLWTSLGNLPGTVLGVWIVAAVSASALSAVAGASVIVAVLISLVGRPIAVTTPTALAAGFTSGVIGTAAAIGGPPLALLYQHHEGPTVRSTLAGSFLVAAAMSIVALGAAGEIHGWQLLLALVLLPAVAVGLVASHFLHRRLDAHWLRPAVLAFAAVAGAAAVARGLG